MNTLDNSIDRLLADVSEEAVKADAKLLEGFARTAIPKDVRHRTLTAVKTGKRTSPSERLYRKAARIAAAFVAVICIAYAANIYATYERKEIWGIDIVDKGNSFDIIINSTVSSPETIEKVCEITAMPNEYTKFEAFSNLFLHLYEYYEGETLAFSLSQRAGNARATNADDDATFEEIWIKNNKAIFIIYNQTEQTGIFWFDGEYTYLLHSYTGEDIDYLTQLANSVK